ncbi:zinc finger FYVE domain containing [Pyrenophora seminiperda CCB06]|uniref:Zinc finger FYVE domain containing n=1 Tax=Pyrenophora seminiperda CCB06 TaxID=1302712 RepID=A0A3M7LWT8_9PLEO|nr:zinc finger FYVE domain containing [Pyrenophora seminiperda CCB06]
MTDSDDDLLARLNALKKSSVSLNSTHNVSIGATNPPKPTDDLAARFARLGSASPSASPQLSRTASTNNAGAPIVAPGAPSYLEGIANGIGGSNVEFNEEDEKSLEELLGELNDAVGDPKEWHVSRSEQQDVGQLLKDMRKILPEVVNSRAQDVQQRDPASKEKLTDWESIEVNVGSGEVGRTQEGTEDDHLDNDEEGRKKSEDEEADDLIARVMAELEISKKYDPDDESESGDKKQEDTMHTSLTLPSAPKSLPEDDFDRTQALEDDFTARLAALSAPHTDSLGLPSAPSFAPRRKPPFSTNLQNKVDEEIDTWCIICQDDATLKCLGCDDDLYCQNCWMEGHRGEAAGLEERGHKAVLYSKKKKQKTAV